MADSPLADRPLIRIGVSSCLLGQRVRYDGGHKQDRLLTETLGRFFQWVPVCPEVELGLGTPREAIQLVQLGGDVRLRYSKTQEDLTLSMGKFVRSRVAELAREDLGGYILKKDSPSCGMERVKVHQQVGPAKRNGVGLFAAALLERFPHLPIEEEGRLGHPRLRENWIERVFAYDDLKRLFAGRWRLRDVVEFHARYKFSLLAHAEKEFRELGRLVADARSLPRVELRQRFESTFMAGLKKIATPKTNANVPAGLRRV